MPPPLPNAVPVALVALTLLSMTRLSRSVVTPWICSPPPSASARKPDAGRDGCRRRVVVDAAVDHEQRAVGVDAAGLGLDVTRRVARDDGVPLIRERLMVVDDPPGR